MSHFRCEPASPDPVLAAARYWIVRSLHLDSMVRQWQHSEHQLSVRSRTLNMPFEVACESDLPEAHAMRALDKRIAAAQSRMDEALSRVRGTRATSLEGVIAKLEIVYRIEVQSNWREDGLELFRAGIADLRRLAAVNAPPAALASEPG